MNIATECVHFENDGDQFGAVSPPIYQTATFRQLNSDEFGEYDYTRSGNPTRKLLEDQLARLEKGAYASAFSSGMAAITALTRLLNAGDEVIAGNDLYGGTVRLLEQVLPRFGISVRYTDTSDTEKVAAAVTEIRG